MATSGGHRHLSGDQRRKSGVVEKKQQWRSGGGNGIWLGKTSRGLSPRGLPFVSHVKPKVIREVFLI